MRLAVLAAAAQCTLCHRQAAAQGSGRAGETDDQRNETYHLRGVPQVVSCAAQSVCGGGLELHAVGSKRSRGPRLQGECSERPRQGGEEDKTYP